MQSEVVFLYGPPCSGKTLFCNQRFFQTHERICPQVLFKEDPSLGLRAVILNVVSVLNKGKSVVVDDDNSNKKTRRSYFNILKNKIPHCTYRAVNFRVSAADGSFICQWAREWELAHQFECMSLNAPFKDTAMDVEQWFEKTISEAPDEEEGFHDIVQVEVQLVCDTPYKFVIPALILQWEGLFEEEEDRQSNVHKKAIDVINNWSCNNPCGRVILFRLNEKQVCGGGKCACVDGMKRVVREWTKETSIPVFFVHVCTFPWNFDRPPNPGLFAWLQRLHSIDLSHRATFFVWTRDDPHKAALAAGIKCIKADKLLNNPQMINAVLGGLTTQLPECVKNALFVWSGCNHRPAACVPLFHRIMSSHHSSDTRDVTVTNDQLYHGVCFQDMETFQSYNTRYQHYAIPTEPASEDLFSDRGSLPSYQKTSTRQRELDIHYLTTNDSEAAKCLPDHDKPSDDRTMDQSSISSGRISPRHFIKHVTREDIQGVAHSAGHFKRGEACVKLIRSVATSVEQDGFLFSAKCLGSQGQLYDVTVVLSDKGIVRTSCSCADPAGQHGKCKHSVGLLLWCKNEENVKDVNINLSSSSDKGKLRHLEETVVKSVLVDASGRGSKARNDLPPTKLRTKRMKTKRITENTLYCLSPEELLQTAEEILEEYQCSLGNNQLGIADHSKGQLTQKNQYRDMKTSDALKRSYQRFSRENPTYLLEKNTLHERAERGNLSPDSTAVVPDTFSTVSVESHSSERGDQSAQADLSSRKERREIVSCSILDDFI